MFQVLSKAENGLNKAHKKEETTAKTANKAVQKHDVAASNLHKAEKDLRVGL